MIDLLFFLTVIAIFSIHYYIPSNPEKPDDYTIDFDNIPTTTEFDFRETLDQ